MTIKSDYVYLLIIATLIIGNFSCSKGKNIPDVSDINIDLNIERFDQAISQLDTNDIAANISQLEAKYPAFFNLYFNKVLPLKTRGTLEGVDTNFLNNVRALTTNSYIRQLMDTCTVEFTNFEPLTVELEEAFQYYKYYFPNSETPNVYTFISEYAYQNFIFDDNGKDGLGIGIDMFLGENYPYAKYIPNNPAFSSYLTRAFNKEHLVKKTIETLVDDKVGAAKGDRLLDYIINNGKKLYILDQLLPHESEEVKLEYTTEQLAWCKDNELQIWAYFLGEDLLYSSERRKIRKLIEPSPTGPSDMPGEAPGRTANWIGYQIVKSYMERYPSTSLEELIAQNDAQKLMDLARYRPRK